MSSKIVRILLAIRVVWQVNPIGVLGRANIPSVWVVRTFSQSICIGDSRCERIDELVVRIAYWLVVIIFHSFTNTNLAAFYLDQCIAKYTSELTTTDDGFHDECRTADSHIRFSYV